MKAIVVDDDGNLVPEMVERPVPGRTEVLIRTAAAGLNAADWKIPNSPLIDGMFPPGVPRILGWDVAGEVVEKAEGVTRFEVGDRVFGMPRFPAPAQAYAEFVLARGREVARTPDNVTDVEAAAMPLAVLTAWQALVDTMKIGEGHRILIHAASGGVGHLAVQIAKVFGAEVWGTASASKHEQLRSLGLDHPIDYKTERFEEIATDMDFVFDAAGFGDYPTRSLQSLKPGGILVSPTLVASPEEAAAAGVTAMSILVEPDYASLEKIADLMESRQLKPVVSETRPLERVGELHQIGLAGAPFGKLVAVVS